MQTSFSELEYAAKKKQTQTRRDCFLADIETLTPWAALELSIAPFYPRFGNSGRPPIGLVRMLRMYVAQQCFGLSDDGMEDALYDSQAIRRSDDVWRFATDPGVPFTNNLAEQAVRMPKVKQKISGCFRTPEGADTFCVIRSYLATMHKQGANLFESLIQTFQGAAPQPRLA
jgi:hypothetical protein